MISFYYSDNATAHCSCIYLHEPPDKDDGSGWKPSLLKFKQTVASVAITEKRNETDPSATDGWKCTE
jgi:hypothetical protein